MGVAMVEILKLKDENEAITQEYKEGIVEDTPT
jgi:hypothetical protein